MLPDGRSDMIFNALFRFVLRILVAIHRVLGFWIVPFAMDGTAAIDWNEIKPEHAGFQCALLAIKIRPPPIFRIRLVTEVAMLPRDLKVPVIKRRRLHVRDISFAGFMEIVTASR